MKPFTKKVWILIEIVGHDFIKVIWVLSVLITPVVRTRPRSLPKIFRSDGYVRV